MNYDQGCVGTFMSMTQKDFAIGAEACLVEPSIGHQPHKIWETYNTTPKNKQDMCGLTKPSYFHGESIKRFCCIIGYLQETAH